MEMIIVDIFFAILLLERTLSSLVKGPETHYFSSCVQNESQTAPFFGVAAIEGKIFDRCDARKKNLNLRVARTAR